MDLRRAPALHRHTEGAGRRRRLLRLIALLSAPLLLVAGLGPAQAAPIVGDTPQAAWRVNGRVYATQIIGNTVVLGGQFTTATSPSGESVARKNLAAFRLDTGELIRTWKADAGATVRALDHDGTWLYVGGSFGRVGTVTNTRLARVRIADAFVDPGFRASFDNTVRALDVRSGALWVGGVFLTVNGQPRARLAKVDLSTGALDASFAPAVNHDVWAVVKNPTSETVYLAGPFSQVGGVARSGVAAVSATSGAVRGTVFTSSSRPTLGLDINDAGTRVFGAGGSGANTMAAWSTTTGARVWRHVVMGDVQGVTHYGGKVYFGFHDGYADDTRLKVLAADEGTGELDTLFRPRFNNFWGVFAISASDAGVVVGGEFSNVSGVASEGWARFLATGVTTPPPPPTGVSAPYVTAETPWRFWDRGNLAAGWQAPGASDATWSTGAGHFGYGDGDETTVLACCTGTTRHLTSYFRTTFSVPKRPEALTLELIADDGAVVYLNGVEVARDNMPAGTVTATTRAATNRSGAAENVARDFTIAPSALAVGTNTLAVEVHQDSSSSSDLSFGAALVGTVDNGALVPPVNQPPVARFTSQVSGREVTLDASSSSDDSGVTGHAWSLGDGTTLSGQVVSHTYAVAGSFPVTLTVTDAQGLTSTTTGAVQTTQAPATAPVFEHRTGWKWYYRAAAPGTGWAARDFSDAAWDDGTGFLGWGAPQIVTGIDTFASTQDRPRAAYFRKTVQVTDLASVVSLEIEAVADDGAVLYVNGVEVGRQNMPAGIPTHMTYAPTARRHAAAVAAPLVVQVPASLLVEGANVIAAETHLNHRGTTDFTFGARASLTRR